MLAIAVAVLAVSSASAKKPKNRARRPVDPAVTAATPGAPAPQTRPRRLRLGVFGDLDGHLFDPNCRENRTGAANLAHLVGDIERARAAWQQEAGIPMPVVGIGDVLGTGAIGRFILGAEDRGAAEFSRTLARINPALIGIGNGELSVPPAQFHRYLNAARAAGLHVGTANLACEATGAVACAGGPDQSRRIIDVGGLKVGLYTLQYDDLAAKVEAEHLAGLEFTDPADATYDAIKDLRDGGAELIVAVVHRGGHGAPEEELLQMAEVLRGDVDLIVSDGVPSGSKLPRVLRVGEGRKTTTVVSVLAGRTRWYEVDLALSADGHIDDATVHAHAATAKTAPDPAARTWLLETRTAYCAKWSKPIGSFQLARPMSFADFRSLVLHVMREAAGADVAFINTGAFETRHAFPLAGNITLDDLNRIFRFANKVVTYKISGEELEGYLAADPGEDGGKRDLSFVGAEVRDDDTLYVNGRRLDYRLNYRVVTIDFLAHGGDGTIEPVQDTELVRAGAATLLMEHLQRWLAQHSGKPMKTPSKAFASLWDKPLWRMRWDTRTELSDSRYGNPAGYQDVRLTNLNAVNLNIFADIGLRMNTRNHGWSNRLLVDYSQTKGADTSFDPPAEYTFVNSDELRGETSYEFRWLRDTLLGRKWWAPLLVAYARLRTEVDVPAAQKYRQFDIEALGGAAWELGPLELRLSVGLNRELLRIDPGPYNRAMFAVGYFLERYPVLEVSQSHIYLQLEGDVRVKGPGGDNRQEFYFNNLVSFEILGPLEIYASLEFFGLRADGPAADFLDRTTGLPRAGGGQFAHQVQTAFGLRLNFVTSLQMH